MVFWYAIWSASLPAEAFILAHWPALSGIHFGGFRERLVTPNNWFRGWRDGSARLGIGKFLEPLQKLWPIAYGLFPKVVGSEFADQKT